MSLLKDFEKKYPSIHEAVMAYVAEVTARYSRHQTLRNPTDRRVKCNWVIEYQSKRQKQATILLMPLFLLMSFLLGGHGHGSFFRKKLAFETNHYLPVEIARKLKWHSVLRTWLLPFAVLAMMVSGFLLIFWFGMLCCWIVGIALYGMSKDSTGFDLTHLGYVIAPFVVGGIVFTVARYSQIALRKIGRPPDADIFSDQEIKLISVDVE